MKLSGQLAFFKIIVFALSFVPIAAGLAGIINGPDLVSIDNAPVKAQSHFRYLSGLLMAIGIGFLTILPAPVKNRNRFVLLTFIVITGGVARLTDLLINGWAGNIMTFALINEIIIVPLLCLWLLSISAKIKRQDSATG